MGRGPVVYVPLISILRWRGRAGYWMFAVKVRNVFRLATDAALRSIVTCMKISVFATAKEDSSMHVENGIRTVNLRPLTLMFDLLKKQLGS